MIENFAEIPIRFCYSSPSTKDIQSLIQEREITVLKESSNLILDQTYYKMRLEGALERTYTRKAVARRLYQALEILGKTYSIIVYDTFRSRKTQKALFDSVADRISGMEPTLSPTEVYSKTKNYIVHPDDKEAFPVPPHNSGGAIDLALRENDQLLKFGSGFDDPSKVSSTDFFEAEFDPMIGFTENEWLLIRKNRRILFHVLTSLGFTNYREEWWHYDLGDCMWANEHSIHPVFQSLEAEVDQYERNV